MIAPNVTEVFIKGTPRERGISYGTQAADAIHRCIAHYADFIGNATGMTWQEAGDGRFRGRIRQRRMKKSMLGKRHAWSFR